MARIPPKTVSADDEQVLANLEADLKRVVYGQDTAIAALASAIKLARAGLREPEKPIGCYLFSGPTGVGKTEVAKQLAVSLGVELLRFDMSEYMERHTVSRLIGAPPGYVGFDQGGLLTDGVDQHPHCVLLLDEIEKAHPDLFNILLQVMDHGKLTDHNGKQIDFRNVILIMTTNAGASDAQRAAIGFGSTKREGDDVEAINRLFTPEFRNRLDAIIPFGSLPIAGRPPGGAEVRHAAGGPACRARRHLRPVAGGDRLARRQGLRRAHGCAAARPRHPGAHQEAARRRGAVRQAQEGRHGARHRRDQGKRRDRAEARIAGRRTAAQARRRKSPSATRAPRKAAVKRAGRKLVAQAPKEPLGGKDGAKRSLVPQLPRKG